MASLDRKSMDSYSNLNLSASRSLPALPLHLCCEPKISHSTIAKAVPLQTLDISLAPSAPETLHNMSL